MKPVHIIRYAALGLLLGACGKLAYRDEDAALGPAALDAAIAENGYALAADALGPRQKSQSRFLIQLVKADGTPLVGGAVTVTPIAAADAVPESTAEATAGNAHGNQFTLFVRSGPAYRIEASVPGFDKVSRTLELDDANPIDVAFALALPAPEKVVSQ
jgi:hypothetical protein